jgi:UDP-N-acetylmuramoylalanine--D-glutamate ligase
MNWKEKKFLVFGTGLSGIAAVELLYKNHLDVCLFEGNRMVKEEQIRKKSPVLSDVPLIIGELEPELIEGIDIAVLSPGVPVDLPIVDEMRQAGIEIWGEIELAFRLSPGRVLAVTGTNGKTTTTTLLGEIMAHAYADVKVVGNIGIPYTKMVPEISTDTVVVAEISSFQLETVHTFAPCVSAILNISEDHLNRHHTMENYIQAKMRIAAFQSKSGTCVLNYEDNVLRAIGQRLAIPVLYFSSERELAQGLYLKGDQIMFAAADGKECLCNIHELQIFGKHNYENVMAAAAMALSFGVTLAQIHEVLVQFKGVEHRIEFVAEKKAVRFFNDSKGTNPDAAIKAIEAMQWPTHMICGGYDKESEYDGLIHAFEGKVKKLVLLGATREKIAESALRCGFPQKDIIFVPGIPEAVEICYASAKPGEAVLLSPACASWDMFRDYEERGDLFKKKVIELKE